MTKTLVYAQKNPGISLLRSPFLGILAWYRVFLIQEPVANFLVLIHLGIVQAKGAQVTPVAVEPIAGGCSAGSHHLEDFVGNGKSGSDGHGLGGGYSDRNFPPVLIGVTRTLEDDLQVVINDPSTNFYGFYYTLDEFGKRSQLVQINPEIPYYSLDNPELRPDPDPTALKVYDARTRPWFQTAVNVNSMTYQVLG
jgi:hypothetical protein